MKRIAGLAGCLWLAAVQASTPVTASTSVPARTSRAAGVPAPVALALAAGHLPPGSASFAVLAADSGRMLASLNGTVPRSPASTMKLVTTFATLDLLGPAFAWHTVAYARGARRGDSLEGDLILRGGGDPYMTLERWWSFVHAVRATGLRRIHGDVLIDDTAFSMPPEKPGAFDGRPHRAYNVAPDALMVNFQSVEFRVAPDISAGRVEVVATPAPVNLTVDNRIDYVSGPCIERAARVDFDVPTAGWDRAVFTGALSAACAERSVSRVMLTAPTYAFGTFVELWREAGGEFDGAMRTGPVPADAQQLVSFDSLPLGEVIRLTNKYSNNLMARHLFLTLGSERYGPPATAAKSAQALAVWWRAMDLPAGDLAIENGSGLSRSERISALAMARMLAAAHRSRYAPEFVASLPLAGIDGTLRARMRGTDPGSVRLKTGHLDGVTAVAGYVTGRSGKCYVLVSFVNDQLGGGSPGEPVHAALVRWIQSAL